MLQTIDMMMRRLEDCIFELLLALTFSRRIASVVCEPPHSTKFPLLDEQCMDARRVQGRYPFRARPARRSNFQFVNG
jgi:hypothetical protein